MAGRLGHAGPGRIRLDVPDRDGRAGQHATLLVHRFASQRRQARLRECGCGDDEHARREHQGLDREPVSCRHFSAPCLVIQNVSLRPS